MYVLDASNQLLEQPTCFHLSESTIATLVLLPLDYVVEQFATVDVLHHQEQVLSRFDDFVQLHDVRVPNQLQNVNFSADSFDVSDIYNAAFLQYFDGDWLAGEGVRGRLDFSEGALSKGASECNGMCYPRM